MMHAMNKSTDTVLSHQTLLFPSYHEDDLHPFAELSALIAVSGIGRHISSLICISAALGSITLVGMPHGRLREDSSLLLLFGRDDRSN